MRKGKSIGDGIKSLWRVLAVMIASMIVFGMMSLSPFAAEPDKVVVDLPGVTGASNNLAFAFDRYILIAPYAPSNTGDDASDEPNNHFIYLIDTKKPNSEPKAKDLTTAQASDGSSKRLFYPTKLVFDPETNIAYVRGTRYEQR